MRFLIPELVAFAFAWCAVVASVYAITETNKQHTAFQKELSQ